MRSRLFAAAIALVFISTAPHAAGPRLVVLEWGTFAAFQRHDREQVWCRPHVKTDVPTFVYARDVENGGVKGVKLLRGKESQSAVLRMETPVIYFYSDSGRTVDVRVRLPKG